MRSCAVAASAKKHIDDRLGKPASALARATSQAAPWFHSKQANRSSPKGLSSRGAETLYSERYSRAVSSQRSHVTSSVAMLREATERELGSASDTRIRSVPTEVL